MKRRGAGIADRPLFNPRPFWPTRERIPQMICRQSPMGQSIGILNEMGRQTTAFSKNTDPISIEDLRRLDAALRRGYAWTTARIESGLIFRGWTS